MQRSLTCLALVTTLAVAACSRQVGNAAPPKVTGGITMPEQPSTVVVPVGASLDELERGLDQRTPRELWTIDRHLNACIKAKRVDLGIAKLKVTPDLGCRITGTVTRGPVQIGGRGDRLIVTLPIHARISAQDVGGVAGETATGSAIVRATGSITIHGDWQPTAKMQLSYDWTQPPGVDLLGQRITFTDKADEKLRPVLAKLERDLPQELSRLHLRQQLEQVWRQSFATLQLSRRNPPVWMRVAPRRLGYGGYRVDGRALRLTLRADALTQTFVGHRPADPIATALPPPSTQVGAPHLKLFIPVLADYAELEPVVQRTLRKLAARGISLKGIGAVDAAFGRVTVYATTDHRIAVGVHAKVKARSSPIADAEGDAWLAAQPFNQPGSQRVQFRNLEFATKTNSQLVDLLAALFADPVVRAGIADGLSHDFAPDYRKLIGKVERAIGERREGDFVLRARVTSVRNGRIAATGAGLFMPVAVTGQANIAYRPR
ncbi:DUF4403 family protein [uncultured Sphingomonas sp.]|uniref:DUF4403 family protein n=1 Tax=uncultured Sphingomonas sp. TaxID=158754 RepID=UPI0025D50C8C|nr:DUF4403 family protein [uncultured Sphingomonas sp.]